MTTYNTSEKNQLITNIYRSNSQEDKDKLTDLIRTHNWNMIYKRSQEEFIHKTINPGHSNYYNLFLDHISKQPSDNQQMSILQTARFLKEWTDEQNIQLGQLILEIYVILKMYHPKKNTFYLQGQSNAGKTFLIHMILPQKDKVGSHITSKDFAFQECTTKSVILINELNLASQAEAELYKNILGGEPTYINVKNKPAELLHRKPVFLTSNEAIYRFVSNEKTPLLNRMYYHMHLSTSTVINKYTTIGIPSPGYLNVVFKNLEHLENKLNLSKDETFLDYKDAILEQLTDSLLGLKHNTTLPDSLKQLIESLKVPTQTTLSTSEQSTQTEDMETTPPTTTTANSQTQTDPPPTTQKDHQTPSTTTTPVNTVHPFDTEKDQIDNPNSSININQEAHQSDLEIETSNPENNSDYETTIITFRSIDVRTTPPRSPSPEPPESPIDTPTRPSRHPPRRTENATSTPIRNQRPQRRRTPYRPINSNRWLTTRPHIR